MDRSALEVVVVSAAELGNVHHLHNLKPYPVVSICDDDGNCYYDSQENKTVDPKGRSNPVWGAFFEFNIDPDLAQQKQLLLIVKLKSHRTGLSSKFIGEVRVPIAELFNDFGDAVDRKSVIRKVLGRNGESQGKLTFTYQFRKALDPPAARPQSANENPKSRKKCHPIFKVCIGGATSGLVTAFVDWLQDL